MKHLKAITLILFLTGFAWQVQATEQYPDYILYGGKKYELAVSWGHPSPLQVLYIRTNTQSPFQSWSTANYRGHIATWRISDGKLYLVNVDTRRHRGRTGTYWAEEGKRLDTLAAPGYFGIASLEVQPTADDGAVVADWFSGVLEIGDEVKEEGLESAESEGVRYVYVRYGEVVDDQWVTGEDFKRMQTMTENDTSDRAFMDKYMIALLNNFYISYYFQSGMSHDDVLYKGHTGRFEGQDFRPQLMSLFDYDPMRFPFNWENFQRNGTPVCTWSISNDSLFINSITLYSGLGFYEHDEDTVGLGIFKPERIKDGKVFAFWMDGERTIEYGQEVEGEFGSKEFRMERQQRIVLDSGRIVQSTWTPSDFNAVSSAATSATCNPEHVYRCDHWGARDRYKELPVATTFPSWTDGNESLQSWFDNHPLTDPRAKEMMFRTVLLFKVNCRGEASEWAIASKGKGVLFELSNQVLEIARQLPNGWTPATDENGKTVDCWQVLQFNVNEGNLKCFVQKKK